MLCLISEEGRGLFEGRRFHLSFGISFFFFLDDLNIDFIVSKLSTKFGSLLLHHRL